MVLIIESLIITFLIVKYQKLKIKPFLKSWNAKVIGILLFLYIGLTTLNFLGYYDLIQYRDIYQLLVFFGFWILVYVNVLPLKRICSGILCLFVGSGLNQLAINFNNGKMPIFPTNSIATKYITQEMLVDMTKFSPIHTIGNYTTTKLIPLCDIFDLGFTVFSIGDLFIYMFFVIILMGVIKKLNKESI